ncbi:hypothetical protein [Frankia sp. Mgl5]|uniref:hypothetical protein n=1 Tax=Frankia sp. Mgl5 TaxID=2933793 RepID=UPI002551E677|nr:hypothetical protein [Frankia sp. Mgl5]
MSKYQVLAPFATVPIDGSVDPGVVGTGAALGVAPGAVVTGAVVTGTEVRVGTGVTPGFGTELGSGAWVGPADGEPVGPAGLGAALVVGAGPPPPPMGVTQPASATIASNAIDSSLSTLGVRRMIAFEPARCACAPDTNAVAALFAVRRRSPAS